MTRATTAATFATAIVAGIILLASPYILRAFGTEFVQYQYLLVWVAVAQVINAASGSAPLLLAMSGDMKRRMRAEFLTLVTQIGLAALLIPTMGAPGAVVALVAATLMWAGSHWWLALRTTGIDTSAFGLVHSAKASADWSA
jgi:O-antigen/teichoic acid export membrane protein